MPELPEVETVRTVLAPMVIGQTISTITVNLDKVIANQTTQAFITKLSGQSITDFTRRGKFLTLHMKSGDYVVLHLRMTGTLIVEEQSTPPVKHTNLILNFTNGKSLRFIDSRGFGHWWYFPCGAVDTSGQQALGPEATAVTLTDVQQKIIHHRTALKTLLLNQHNFAGIGNIYADEICFHAGIRPARSGNSLNSAELERLAQAIPAVINDFIQFHHVSFEIYAQSKGTSYQNDTNLLVYGRAKQPCKKCGHPLTGIRIGQRSSVFCEHCQK